MIDLPLRFREFRIELFDSILKNADQVIPERFGLRFKGIRGVGLAVSFDLSFSFC
jgi:hypothetical protein